VQTPEQSPFGVPSVGWGKATFVVAAPPEEMVCLSLADTEHRPQPT